MVTKIFLPLLGPGMAIGGFIRVDLEFGGLEVDRGLKGGFRDSSMGCRPPGIWIGYGAVGR